MADYRNTQRATLCRGWHFPGKVTRIPNGTRENNIIIIIYPLTTGVVGAPQMISQPFSSIFLFSTALCDLANSRPGNSLMLSSNLFLCLSCLLHPFTVPCNMVLARPDERETCPYHGSLRLFAMVRRSSCGPFAVWILARTSSLVPSNGELRTQKCRLVRTQS